MTKQRDDTQDLKRRLGLLDKLDGGVIVCADGVFLVEPGTIRDPRPLVKACEAGRPTSAAVRAAMGAGPQPLSIDRALLAAAHRDLRAIEAAPALRRAAEEAPRIFRRFGALDDAWFSHKRARLALIGALLDTGAREPTHSSHDGGRPPSPIDPAWPLPTWLARVIDFVRLVHGDGAVRAVEGAIAHLSDGARARRAEARRAIAEVVAALEGGREPSSPPAIAATLAIREAARLPGRSRARRVAAVMRDWLGVKAAPEDHGGSDAALPLADQVRAVGERVVAALDHPSSPAYRDRAHHFFAHYALAFDPRPRDGSTLAVGPEEVNRGLTKLGDALDRLAGKRITLTEALAILSFDMAKYLEGSIVDLVEAGFPIAKARALAGMKKLDHLSELVGDPKAAEAYADWVITLGPHYASLGLSVPITPDMFATFRGTRREDLGVLAMCLMKHHGRAAPGGAEEAIARLDATLGLFRHRPHDAAKVLADLAGTSPGAGSEAFPEFATWLGDDALLDRAVHLMRLADLPVALSHSLRADFDRRAAQDRERAHLAALASPSPDQRDRLARLERGDVEVPDPARTRRRLEDRVREMHALAYEVRLAAIFRGIVKEIWGISLASLTPAWHDAIRFSFAVDDNRDLLGTVLRAAAGGLDLDRALPQNRAFIAEASGRFDVEAWLAPRERDVVIGGETFTLAIERDPVEVLRMGIPFGTCLSLEGGGNAASTIVNAADANKRVIYLRDRARKIIARKLIAVSENDTLLGYRLYVAARDKEAAIAAAFDAMCWEIAEAARLPLASSGTPKQIHAGFWYDDGTTPFTGAPGAPSPDVEAYCRALGQVAPRAPSLALAREATAFDALARPEAARVRAAVYDRNAPNGPERRAARWILERSTPAEARDLAKRSSTMAELAVEIAREQGALAMLDRVGQIASFEASQRAVCDLVRFPRNAEIAAAIVSAGFACKRNAEHFDDHGFEHQTMYLLPAYAAEIPIAAVFALCDRVEPLWDYILEQSSGCRPCRESGEYQMIDAIEAGYARRRDPETVLRCLASSRSGRLSRRAALRIAAVYALTTRAPLPCFPPPSLQPVRPSPEAMRALARLRQRGPEWEADPDLFAALLRQSAGVLPHGMTLPVPRDPPFEALGDLLVQLDLEGVLGPWLAPTITASEWDPGPWEMYFHRREPTARRAAIAAEAARHAPRASHASDRLAYLGDVDAMAPLLGAEPDRARWEGPSRRGKRKRSRGEPGSALSPLSRANELARCIAAQVEAADASGPFAIDVDRVDRAIEIVQQKPGAVDPGLVVAAFTIVERHLAGSFAPAHPSPDPAGAPAEGASLAAAFTVLLRGRVPTRVLRCVSEAIVARPALSREETDFVIGFLCDHTTYYCPEVPPDLAVAIARHERLRSTLYTALAKAQDQRFEPTLSAVLAEAGRASGDALEEAMLRGIVEAVVARGTHETVTAVYDSSLFRRAARAAVAGTSAAGALGVYQNTESHEQAAVFLEELRKSHWFGTPTLKAAVGALREWGEDGEKAGKYEWLVRAMKGPRSEEPGSA